MLSTAPSPTDEILAPAGPGTVARHLEAIRARGRAAAHHIAGTHGFRRIYTAGAPLAGLGSLRSDIDIFVVLDEEEQRETEQVEYEGSRVDIEYVRLPALRELVEACRDHGRTGAPISAVAPPGRARADLVTRFLLSEIVVDDGRLADLHRQLTEHQEGYRALLVARHALDAQNRCEDVVGALLNGDVESAGYQSREMVYRAAEALLCAAGDPYVNTKWLWQKWRRTLGLSLGAGVWDAVRDLGGTDTRDTVLRNMWLTQDLLVMAATGYHHTAILAARAGLPLRDPRYALLTDSGRYHLTKDVGEGIELSREGALLWAVAHGRSKEDALTEALRCYGVNGPAVAREEVSAYYDHIVAAGLLLGAGDDAHEDVRSAPDPSRV
ncbi:hypothetical protein [Streptomyces lavendulocolor]|uniref:hypothetical protein n=1 Tax=Streptomyces lavendulocolor TaxID=67316 RepID=UPI003C2CF766